MPRPKKTTPTVATTEPDTNLNPDRAQVAAVADLPRESDEAQVPTSVPATPEAMDGLRATIAEQSARIAELEAELVRVAMESLTPVPVPARPLTPHEIAHGYLAITSGKVRAARWKRNILHDIRDPDMVIGQIDHLTDGWAPSVKGAAAPPMKTEAEARAWCEARCGWTVVQ